MQDQNLKFKILVADCPFSSRTSKIRRGFFLVYWWKLISHKVTKITIMCSPSSPSSTKMIFGFDWHSLCRTLQSILSDSRLDDRTSSPVVDDIPWIPNWDEKPASQRVSRISQHDPVCIQPYTVFLRSALATWSFDTIADLMYRWEDEHWLPIQCQEMC